MTSMLQAAPWVDVLALGLCVAFLAYVLSILVPFLRQQPSAPGNPEDFAWHALIPCLDEEIVIGRTVRRLRQTYPQMHVWCVEDASEDGTARVLDEVAAEDPFVHVVHRHLPEARQGKGAALNAGWTNIREFVRREHPAEYADVAERTIISVVDGDGRLSPDALTVISGPSAFGDEAVGAVQVQVRMLNRGLSDRLDGDDPAPESAVARSLVWLQDMEFRTVLAAMQQLRRSIGSVGMGGNGQFTRLAVLDQIAEQEGTPWHGALLEDFELGLHVLLIGRRNQYCDDTWVAQEGLPDVRSLVRQRARWAQGGMQCIKYFDRVIRARNLSTAAALEICYFLLLPWTQLVGSIVFATAAGFVTTFALTTPGGLGAWLGNGAWGVLPLTLMFGIGPLALWGPVYRVKAEFGLSRRRALLLGLGYWIYTYLMIAAVWKAAVRIALSKRDWAKTHRVYTDPSAVPKELVSTTHSTT